MPASTEITSDIEKVQTRPRFALRGVRRCQTCAQLPFSAFLRQRGGKCPRYAPAYAGCLCRFRKAVGGLQ